MRLGVRQRATFLTRRRIGYVNVLADLPMIVDASEESGIVQRQVMERENQRRLIRLVVLVNEMRMALLVDLVLSVVPVQTQRIDGLAA